MKSRRRISMLLLMAASVFLLLAVSCGIPKYITPTVTITKNSISDGMFNVSYKGEGVGDSGKVGLLLLYYPEHVDSNESSKIISKFKSTYKISTYDGIVVSVADDTYLYDFVTTDSTVGYVYAFELDGTPVVAPSYTFSLPTAGDFSSAIMLEYSAEDGTINLVVDGVKQSVPLTLVNEANGITVFAALSVQSSQYSNLYWSDLFNLGYISLN